MNSTKLNSPHVTFLPTPFCFRCHQSAFLRFRLRRATVRGRERVPSWAIGDRVHRFCFRGEAAKPGICCCIRFEVCSLRRHLGSLSFGDKRSRLPAGWAWERVPSGRHNSISESLWKGLINTDDLHHSSVSAGLLPIAPIALVAGAAPLRLQKGRHPGNGAINCGNNWAQCRC